MRHYWIIICFLSLHALGQKDTAFIYTYGGKENDGCTQVRGTADKGYVLIGNTSSFGNGRVNVYVIKTDSLCKMQWSRAIGGYGLQEGYSVTTTFDKGYALTGFTDSYGSGGYKVYLVRLDSSGNMLWQRAYGGNNWDFGYSVKQTSDSGFIICGQTYSYGAGDGDVYVIKTDKNGDTLWTRAIGGVGCDVGNSVTVRNDSLYLIVGSTTSFGIADTNVYFVELNSKGNVISTKTYGSAYTSAAYAITPTLDGGYMIMGSIDSIFNGIMGQLLLKTDSAGNYQWMSQITNGKWDDMGKDIVQAVDSTYLSVGTSDGGGYGSSSMHIMQHTSTGFYLAGPSMGGGGAQMGNSLTLGANGNVIFAGSTTSYGNGGFDAYLIRLEIDSIAQNYTQVIKTFIDTPIVISGISLLETFTPGIKVFPNPANDNVTILVQGKPGEKYMLSLFNEFGQLILEKPLNFIIHAQYIANIKTQDLSNGVYFYEIHSDDGTRGSGKIMIAR